MVGKEREHVELPLSPLPLFLDFVAKNQLSENTGDGHRSIREKEVGRESCNIFHPEK